MQFTKVVFISYFPLTERTYTNFYFEKLLKNNFEVEYLDLAGLFFAKKNVIDEFLFYGTIKLNNYKDLKNYLKSQDNRNVLYISIMTFEWRVFKLFRLFTKLNLSFGVFARGVFPNSTDSDNKSKFLKKIKKINFENLKAFIGNKIAYVAKKHGYIKTYDYIFKAGKYGFFGIGLGCEIDSFKANIVEVNTVDYDLYLLHSILSAEPHHEYIVFLDQYLPYHPDANYFNIKTVEPEIYFKEINNFFDRLELATGLKIIIAAHPKAEKYKEYNPYNNRTIFFNQSNDLVKEAALVLTHASTAICFPICYNKKIVLLFSKYLNEVLPQFITVGRSIQQACDASIIQMDDNHDLKINKEINLLKYNDFKYAYLTSHESENELSSDIFIKFLQNDKNS